MKKKGKKKGKKKSKKSKKVRIKSSNRKLLEYMKMRPVVRKGRVFVKAVAEKKAKRSFDDPTEVSVFADSHIDPYRLVFEGSD